MNSDIRDAIGRHLDRERYKVDPKAFDTEVMGLQYPDHYEEADRVLETCPFVLWNAPVGHGKSTKIGFSRPVREIAMDRNIRILFGSKTADLAYGQGTQIREALTTNERLIELYGEFKDPIKWSTRGFDVLDRDKTLKGSTFMMTGLHGSCEGMRANLGILDDIIDIESMTSDAERRKTKTWFDSTFSRRLEPNARLWIVGTRWHPEDLYEHIIAKPSVVGGAEKRYRYLKHAAIIDDEKQTVLWPERWSWNMLMEEKLDLGSVMFEARYMNNPHAIAGAIFKTEWLQYVEDLPDVLDHVYQGWDLAISKRETADYTACMTIGVDESKDIYLLDLYRDRLGFPQQTKAIQAQAEHLQWRPRYIGIESNAYQAAAAQHLQSISLLPVVESPTGQRDKVMRIQSMSPYFETGRMKLWRGMRGLDTFVSEFVNFPYGTHDDTLDALWHALQQAMKDTVRDPWIEVDMGTKPTRERPWERR